VFAVVLCAICLAVPPGAVGSKAATVAPTAAQRSAILRAFGAPRAAWGCLTVRLAASNHRYASVRFLRFRRCERWAFNGVNVIKRKTDNRWKILFEGSAYACPLARIPRQVQRDLRVCP
jgi:hypothetical protein